MGRERGSGLTQQRSARLIPKTSWFGEDGWHRKPARRPDDQFEKQGSLCAELKTDGDDRAHPFRCFVQFVFCVGSSRRGRAAYMVQYPYMDGMAGIQPKSRPRIVFCSALSAKPKGKVAAAGLAFVCICHGIVLSRFRVESTRLVWSGLVWLALSVLTDITSKERPSPPPPMSTPCSSSSTVYLSAGVLCREKREGRDDSHCPNMGRISSRRRRRCPSTWEHTRATLARTAPLDLSVRVQKLQPQTATATAGACAGAGAGAGAGWCWRNHSHMRARAAASSSSSSFSSSCLTMYSCLGLARLSYPSSPSSCPLRPRLPGRRPPRSSVGPRPLSPQI